jgi:glycosyltransferase involved in cell wall biosynthesis
VTDLEILRGKRLVHVTTVAQSLVFFRGQLSFLRRFGLEINVVCGPGEGIEELEAREGVRVHVVPMARRIDPAADLVALRALRRIYRRLRPDIVHAHTPKGGLLGVLSARAFGVPLVLYQLRGLRLSTLRGARRALFSAVERTSLNLAHGVIANSHSLRREVLDLDLVAPLRIEVLGAGSGNGVEGRGRFDPDRIPGERRRELRASLGVPEDAVLFLFAGRLVNDKGVRELAEAWRKVAAAHPNAHLVLIGWTDDTDPVGDHVLETFAPARRAHRIPATKDMPSWYLASDVVVLPTYREGMPNVLLEGSAMGRPVVSTHAAGSVDCVRDGETGLLVPVADARALEAAMGRLAGDGLLRARLGAAGRAHMLASFDPETLWTRLAQRYAEGLRAARAGR